MTTPAITEDDLIAANGPIPAGIDSAVHIAQATLMIAEFPFDYTQERINMMAVWLSWHFIGAYRPDTMDYEGMKVSDKSYGDFLKGSAAGQRACVLDIDGYMVGWGKPRPLLWAY